MRRTSLFILRIKNWSLLKRRKANSTKIFREFPRPPQRAWEMATKTLWLIFIKLIFALRRRRERSNDFMAACLFLWMRKASRILNGGRSGQDVMMKQWENNANPSRSRRCYLLLNINTDCCRLRSHLHEEKWVNNFPLWCCFFASPFFSFSFHLMPLKTAILMLFAHVWMNERLFC